MLYLLYKEEMAKLRSKRRLNSAAVTVLALLLQTIFIFAIDMVSFVRQYGAMDDRGE